MVMEMYDVATKLPNEDVPVLIFFKQGLLPLVGMMSVERYFWFNRKKPKWVDMHLSELNERLISHWAALPKTTSSTSQ